MDVTAPSELALRPASVNSGDPMMTEPQIFQDVQLDNSNFSDEGGQSGSASLQTVGRGLDELNAAFSRLQHIGIDRSDIPLPKIVVVGDQSAGKSSLIEALSEIRVPRAAGTCTRCPFHITTEPNNGDWQCTVSIVQQYNVEDEATLQIHDATGDILPLRPWKLNNRPRADVFARVSEPEDLEDVLRRAQIAILNPSKDPQDFLSGSLPETVEHEFSPNYISLELRSMDLPRLSFFDLPGVISQAESDNKEFLVNIVRTITSEYIKDPSSLVLVACSMETDVHNSKALSMVKRLGASDRCIGVLTKPDRVPPGEFNEIWKQILQGNKFKVGHGWFVTKQSAQNEINFTHQVAREREVQFFNRGAWTSDQLIPFRNRLGSSMIQTELSRLLVHSIRQNLPGIYTTIQSKIEDYAGILKSIPEPPKDPYHQIIDCVQTFSSILELMIKGKGKDGDFRQEWKRHKQQFAKGISDLRPRLGTTSVHDKSLKVSFSTGNTKGSPLKRLQYLQSEEMGDLDPSITSETVSPSKRQKMGDGRASPSTAQHQHSMLNRGMAMSYTIDALSYELENFSYSGRQGAVDPDAVDYLISLDIAKWDIPMEKLLHDIGNTIRHHLRPAVKSAFGQWSNTEFFKMVQVVVQNSTDKLLEEQRNVAELYLRHEKVVPPSCENKEELARLKGVMLARFQNLRFRNRARKVVEGEANSRNEVPDNQEIDVKVQKDIKRLTELLDQVPDPAMRELEVMADIRAYYEIASTRFVDNVCRSFEAEIMNRLKETLQQDTMQKVREDAKRAEVRIDDWCERLLAEDQERATRRQDLRSKIQSLEKAKDILDAVLRKCDADRVSLFDTDMNDVPNL